MNKAVFIDKDGTLIKDVPYNVKPALVEFMPGAFEAMAKLKQAGFLLVMVTNQSGIAKGHFSDEELQELFTFIKAEALREGAAFDAIYACPHGPADLCQCRKPLPGMLVTAAEELQIDLSASWMIGDILHDVEAGNRAGCQTMLLDVGNETEWQPGEYRTPDYKVNNWKEIAAIILEQTNSSPGPVFAEKENSSSA